jgi:hypothetical protein
MVLLHPTYFSPIIQYVAIARSTNIIFEVEDNYQKQTYRNRCYIYGSNGLQLLNIPIEHLKGVKQKTKDVKIDYKDFWYKHHLKTLQSAYSSSPFYEFYIDAIMSILNKKYTFLLDLTLSCHEFVMDALQIEIPLSKTDKFEQDHAINDHRGLVLAKSKHNLNLTPYYQVFNESHGFISNLSILDLIFMEGPNTLNYLEMESIKF